MGSDWPHPGAGQPQDDAVLFDLLEEWVPHGELRELLLVKNPEAAALRIDSEARAQERLRSTICAQATPGVSRMRALLVHAAAAGPWKYTYRHPPERVEALC